MRRRPLRTLLLVTSFGTATTIAVTALCVYASVGSRVSEGKWVVNTRVIHFYHEIAVGRTLYCWDLDGGEPPAGSPPMPKWCCADSPAVIAELDAAIGKLGRFDIAYGWPMRSFCAGLTCAHEERHDYARLPDHLVQYPGFRRTIPEIRTLPLTPIITGFTANTTLYAGLWWLIAFASREIRILLRRRRNACVACGYSRQGLAHNTPCPECNASPLERALSASSG